jgi:hypothetical protein
MPWISAQHSVMRVHSFGLHAEVSVNMPSNNAIAAIVNKEVRVVLIASPLPNLSSHAPRGAYSARGERLQNEPREAMRNTKFACNSLGARGTWP